MTGGLLQLSPCRRRRDQGRARLNLGHGDRFHLLVQNGRDDLLAWSSQRESIFCHH